MRACWMSLLLFLEGALQWMLMPASEIHYLVDLGFGNFIRENAANAYPPLMHVQHDAGGFLAAFREKPFLPEPGLR